jgi:hypothetical protein
MKNDPLDDDARRGFCKCGGLGWIYVPDGYADRIIAEDPRLAGRRAALVNSVFPCANHRPDMYERWVHGCLEPDHEAWRCDLCRARNEPKSRRKKTTVGPLLGGADFAIPRGDDE